MTFGYRALFTSNTILILTCSLCVNFADFMFEFTKILWHSQSLPLSLPLRSLSPAYSFSLMYTRCWLPLDAMACNGIPLSNTQLSNAIAHLLTLWFGIYVEICRSLHNKWSIHFICTHQFIHKSNDEIQSKDCNHLTFITFDFIDVVVD